MKINDEIYLLINKIEEDIENDIKEEDSEIDIQYCNYMSHLLHEGKYLKSLYNEILPELKNILDYK